MKNTKTRKIQYKVEKRKSTKDAIIPFLMLQGKQLEQAGFLPNSTAKVTISKNQIIITTI